MLSDNYITPSTPDPTSPARLQGRGGTATTMRAKVAPGAWFAEEISALCEPQADAVGARRARFAATDRSGEDHGVQFVWPMSIGALAEGVLGRQPNADRWADAGTSPAVLRSRSPAAGYRRRGQLQRCRGMSVEKRARAAAISFSSGLGMTALSRMLPW